MKVYLHYPRVGQTILINGIQFIDGVANVPSLPVYHERYYNVKDYPPQIANGNKLDLKVKVEAEVPPNELEVVDDTPEWAKAQFSIYMEDVPTVVEGIKTDSEPSGEEILRMVVEAKKAEIEQKLTNPEEVIPAPKSLVEQYLALDNQGKRIGFMKDKTGKVIRGRDEAVAYLTQLDKQAGF